MGRVGDATTPDPRRSDDAIAVATVRSSNNGDGAVPPQPFKRVRSCPTWWWAHGGCAVDPASLLLAVALLRLVVVPCLNAHKHHVRDPLYFFNSLLTDHRILPPQPP